MDGLPPPQFDHVPSIPVIEHVLSSKDIVNATCIPLIGKPAEGKMWWGCAIRKMQDGKLVCIVNRIDDQIVKRHEYGHCNGWPANHPTTVEMAEITKKKEREETVKQLKITEDQLKRVGLKLLELEHK
jgi:hypothetical protein